MATMRGRSLVASALLSAAASLAATSVCEEARAHGPGSYGFGSRATAMGGAVSADATDFTANYYNPAGLAGDDGLRVGVGYYHVGKTLLIDERDSGVDSTHGLVFGIAATSDMLGFPLAVGIAVSLPDEGLSRITALREEVPRWELYDSRSTVVYLTANAAFRLFDMLDIGGGISFLTSTRGRFEITGMANLQFPYDSQLRHEVDIDLSSVRYPEAGVRLKLAEAASVAVVYRGETNLDLNISGVLDGTLDAVGTQIPLRYELEARTIGAFLPQQVVVGASWKLHPSFRVNADVAWVNWSRYENPTAKTKAKLAADIPPEFPVELPTELKPVEIGEANFSDRIVPRVGLEWYLPGLGETIVRVPVRAGYVYEQTPVPEQIGVSNFVDADRHTLSFGAGIELVEPLMLALDLHAALSIMPERITEKASPVDLVGDYRQRGTMGNVGATLGGTFR